MTTVIAIAGAGAMGKAIIDTLRTEPQYSVKVFSRNYDAKREKDIGVPIIPVNYDEVDSLTDALESNKVHTVIATLAVIDEKSSQSQVNLINAANISTTTKRFVPSEFGVVYHEKQIETFHPVSFKLKAFEELKKTSLEYTLFHNGFFLDFYGAPHVHSYVNPFPFVVDMASNMAAIPGSGNVPLVFTHTFDVAKFVVASLGLEKWPERLFMVGNKVTWNEFVKTAENVKGTKFQVIHDDPSSLAKGNMTELPSHEFVFKALPKPFATRLMSALAYWSAVGEFDFKEESTLNERFPEIKTLTVKEVLERNYS